MANLFTQNPIILDTVWTAGTIPAALAALASGNPQRSRMIKWVNPVTPATDEITITDINGKVLFDEFCSVAHQDVVLWDNPANPYVLKQSQWVLTVLGSGKLYLWR
jgi:hypothetical protein